MKIKIREMVSEDIPQLSRIYLECRKETFYWVDSNTFNLSDFVDHTKGEWILVAISDSKVVGFSSVYLPENFVHNLFVDPTYQGKGIGQSLLKGCFDKKLKTPARLKCVIKNEAACRFYEKLGWKVESTTKDGDMGPYHTYIFEPEKV